MKLARWTPLLLVPVLAGCGFPLFGLSHTGPARSSSPPVIAKQSSGGPYAVGSYDCFQRWSNGHWFHSTDSGLFERGPCPGLGKMTTGRKKGTVARTALTRDRVGPLLISHSDRAQVVAFAGKPTSEFRGSIYRGQPRVDGLYYGCNYARLKSAKTVNGACKTIFWLDARTGTLADFWTRDPRYTTASGVGVGASTAAAERATHRAAQAGCGGAAIRLLSGPPFTGLVLWVSGSHPGPKGRAIGGHISYIWLLGNDLGSELQC